MDLFQLQNLLDFFRQVDYFDDDVRNGITKKIPERVFCMSYELDTISVVSGPFG